MHRTRHICTLALALLLGTLTAAGCGSDPAPTTQKADAETQAKTVTADSTLSVTGTEMAFAPSSLTAKAGNVKFTFTNDGKVEHELIVLKTDAAADSLKPNSKGRVSEADSVGEVSETAPGATKSSVITLTAGKYVIICNVPGHYAMGMRGTLIVT
jgi:uncharacterized cupredoxin-like copper-binding protein